MVEMKLVPVEPTEAMLDAARGLIMARDIGAPGAGYPLGKVADSGFYGEKWAHILSDEERDIQHPLTKAHLAQLLYRAMLAASPQAPAREGGDYTMALADVQEFEKHLPLAAHIERMAVSGRVGSMIEWDAFLTALNAALTPREEAPAVYGKGDVVLSVGDRVRIHTGEEGTIHQFLPGQSKCVNVVFRPGHGGSFFGFECEKVEAPAEGAGEIVEAIDRALAKPCAQQAEGQTYPGFVVLDVPVARKILNALRARTSEPEGRYEVVPDPDHPKGWQVKAPEGFLVFTTETCGPQTRKEAEKVAATCNEEVARRGIAALRARTSEPS